ncbi:MAG: hypothetical protein ABJB97_01485 [Acidobacteriota bacterium]
MPKDNENILFFPDEPLLPSEPPGFAPEAMVRCEECLRANPPTRTDCLYCAAALPFDEKLADLRKPSLRPVEDSVQGHNTILLPRPANDLSEEALRSAARLLKLELADLKRILDTAAPLPLARTSAAEDARLIATRLKEMGITTIVLSDQELALRETPPVQIRGLACHENGLTPRLSVGADLMEIAWREFDLIVTGRLLTKQVQSRERKGRRGENEIVDATELFADDAIMDLYRKDQIENLRIVANSFNFSCLEKKSLLAAENFRLLLSFIRQRATDAEFDDSYNSCRQALELVWPPDQQTGSRGWRRERPGKISVEAVTESNNEVQFNRYSRMRYLMKSGLNPTPSR